PAGDPEHVEVGILPPHDHLDGVVYPVEGVASGYHQLPPHRRVVDPGDRNPHLEHWIAWLGHAADTADRILAQVGEPGGLGLAQDRDAEDVEGGHRDRDVCRDHAPQRVVLD